MSDLMCPAWTHLVLILWMTLLIIMAPLIQGILSSMNGLRRQAQVHPALVLQVTLTMMMTTPLTRMQGTPSYRISTWA